MARMLQSVERQPDYRANKLPAQLIDALLVGFIQVAHAAQGAFELCLARVLQVLRQFLRERLGSCVCVRVQWSDTQARAPIARVRASPSARMQVKMGVSRNV
jgi:hypothetical protein